MASAAWTSTRTSPVCTGMGKGSAGGRPGPNLPSTSSAQTLPKVTLPTRSSMSTPRYRREPPSLSGSAISVSKAITPSRPATVRISCAQRVTARYPRPTATMAVVPDLSRMRRDYETRGLREDDLAPTWVEQFDRWFTDAVAAELPEPNAVVVATADADGAPDARIVLMKGYDEAGFVFVTSYASAKGAQLAVNPRAALVFPWHALQRQGRVTGRVGRVGGTASDDLWDPRPREAQLAAVASLQSTVVDSREELESRVRLLDEETATEKVPRPPTWGGYRVVPESI